MTVPDVKVINLANAGQNGTDPELCKGDHCGIFVQNGKGWEMLAGPFHRKDKLRQAMAVLDEYGKVMTDEQKTLLQQLAQRNPQVKDFAWVAVAQRIAGGQTSFAWLR